MCQCHWGSSCKIRKRPSEYLESTRLNLPFKLLYRNKLRIVALEFAVLFAAVSHFHGWPHSSTVVDRWNCTPPVKCSFQLRLIVSPTESTPLRHTRQLLYERTHIEQWVLHFKIATRQWIDAMRGIYAWCATAGPQKQGLKLNFKYTTPST